MLAAKTIYKYEPVNPTDVVAGVSYPVLFVHEERDDLISQEEMRQLFEASTNRSKEFWDSDTEHSQTYKNRPGEFVARLDSFFSGAAASK